MNIEPILDALIEHDELTHAALLLEHYIDCESQWLGSWRPMEADERRGELEELRREYVEKIRAARKPLPRYPTADHFVRVWILSDGTGWADRFGLTMHLLANKGVKTVEERWIWCK